VALTILDRPQGIKLSSTANGTYSIISNGYGDAVLSGGAGLTTATKIYIYQSFTSYNGFWIVSAYGPTQFRLQRYSGADYLVYTQDHDNVTIYASVGNIDFSCVHLPIVYTLKSSKWPTNTEDSIRNIVGFANDNGNVRITLDGSIDVDELDTITISNSSEDELDGPFQVVTKYSATQFTIDAPYSVAQNSPYTYASATAQKYYNNYAVNVKIYGGLPVTHPWVGLKPYQLITTLSIAPDTDAIVKVNVAEVLKEQLKIQENRPNYDSMPYDLDRFCEFYITYGEQYDDSDGTDISTFESAYQSDYDFFQGVAVDAELPFKNRFSGFLSEYVYASGSPAKFLSDGTPMLFSGHYLDLSFINNFGADNVILRQLFYDQYDNLLGTHETTISDMASHGVLRQEIENVTTSDASIILSPVLWTQLGVVGTPSSNLWTINLLTDQTFKAYQQIDMSAGETFPALSWELISSVGGDINIDVIGGNDSLDPFSDPTAVLLASLSAFTVTAGAIIPIDLTETVLPFDWSTLTIVITVRMDTTITMSLTDTVGTVLSEGSSIPFEEDHQTVQLIGANILKAPNLWVSTGPDTPVATGEQWSIVTAGTLNVIETLSINMKTGDILTGFTFFIQFVGSENVTYTVSYDGGTLVTSNAIASSVLVTVPTTVLTSDATYLRIQIVTVTSAVSMTVTFQGNIGLVLGPDSDIAYTEAKQIDSFAECGNQEIYLTWKNNLGGFDYWLFTTNKDYSVAILDTQQRERNIFPSWPHSFGEHEDTINEETYRSSFPEILVRAENLTQAQVDFIKGIKVSSFVMQMTSKYDRRRMTVDSGSFKVRTDNEKLSTIEFTLRDTARNPSQAL